MSYQVLSPDGLPISHEAFPDKEKARKKAKEWVKRFKTQGYYSSPRYGKIPYDEILDYCCFDELC